MAVLVASEHIDKGWPAEEGKVLARAALELGMKDLVVDMQGVNNGMFVATFFNSFLQEVYDQGGEESLSLAKEARWVANFHAQWEKVEWILMNFKPHGRE